MTATVAEIMVQDAVVSLSDRFDPFFLPSAGITAEDVQIYLQSLGYAPFTACEAALRYMVANTP